MRFLVISSAPLIPQDDHWKAYSPYCKEMDYWAKYVDEVQFCCPIWESDRGLLGSVLPFSILEPIELIPFEITALKKIPMAIWASLVNLFIIYKAMKRADHIHLRCPGNIGLLGCIVQILFPSKRKTAKFAGNWDPESEQPLSYRLQKRILKNTFLTKNMKVLVYGDWGEDSENIIPFFTASYFEKDKRPVSPKTLAGAIDFLFVGTLSPGKRPLYAVKLIEGLYKKGYNVNLKLYGEGTERKTIEKYVSENELQSVVCLKGNQDSKVVERAYKESHFIILPSKSEGWPKVIAEGMFWGCLPLATKVSCVPNMLGNGERGMLLEMDLDADLIKIESIFKNPACYQDKCQKAMDWSRQFTIDFFEEEVKKHLQS